MDSPIYDRPLLSVIIPISDNARNTKKLLSFVKKIASDTEVIVVFQGVSSRAAMLSLDLGAQVIPIGIETNCNEARAIGSAHARGDIVLFMDERLEMPLLYLKKYVTQVKKGSDVVITTCTKPFVSKKGERSPRSAYCLLNHLLGQKSMGSASFENTPFALSRNALDSIGSENFSNPAIALVQASALGLKMTKIVPLATRKQTTGASDNIPKDTRTIYHEHAKAIQLLTNGTTQRGADQDGKRHRALVEVTDVLHLRSVIHLESRVKEGGGWGAKRKTKYSRARKKTQRRSH